MSDITLDTIVSGYNLASINENFVKIETAINDEILHLTGGNNTLQQTLNANSQRIINLTAPVNDSDPARWIDVKEGVIGISEPVPDQTGEAKVALTTTGSALVFGPIDSENVDFLNSGVGAVERDLHDKGSDHICTKDFGAVLDGGGGTDDSAAILAADTAATAAANTNGSVTFNTGISSVGTSITLVSELIFPEGSELYIESGVTLTINGSVDAGHHVIFKGPGLVRIRDADNSTYCSPKIDHIKAAWFSGADWCTRIQEAFEAGGEYHVSLGGGKAVVLLPIGRSMDWGDNTLDMSEATIGSHAVLRGAGGMFGSEFVIPAAAGGGAGIIGIDLRPAAGASDEATLEDFRLIEESGSVVSTCIRGGGTSTVVRNVWLGNANYGWLVDSAIGGHTIDNMWVEACNTNMAYENTGSCSQGSLSNLQLFGARAGGVGLSIGEGAGGSRIKNLRFSNVDITNQDLVGDDNDSVGLRLGPQADGIRFSNLTVRKCNGRAIDVTAPTGMPTSISNLVLEDIYNVNTDAYGIYFNTGDNVGLTIDGFTYDDVDIPFKFPVSIRALKLDNRTDDWSMNDNYTVFKKRMDVSAVFTNSTAIDVFTLTLPNAGPLGATVEVKYTLFDSANNSIYFGVETFACLSNGSTTTYISAAVDQVSGVTAGPYSISVASTLAKTDPGSEGTVTYSINQTHTNSNNCYGEFEVRVVHKGAGKTLGLNPNQFEWDV